jgi:CRISPR-associated protein Csy3
MASQKLAHPAMLSFTRSISASVFPFYAMNGSTDNLLALDLATLTPVRVVRETVRGTQAAAATQENARGVPNIQRVDFAYLPPAKDTLVVAGTVLFTPNSVAPENSNSLEFNAAHSAFTQSFKDAGGYKALAERFVMNALNGSFMWRNRIGFDLTTAIQVKGSPDLSVQIRREDLVAGLMLSLNDIQAKKAHEKASAIVDAVAAALAGDTHGVELEVRASVRMGAEQEVFPSQEMVLDKGKGEGRTLARSGRTDIEQAAFHGRKVSVALKTIDTWYTGAVKPLPVEPYGVDQQTQSTCRKGKETFYDYLLRLPELTEGLKKNGLSSDALYTAAVFVRGGVFSKKAS